MTSASGPADGQPEQPSPSPDLAQFLPPPVASWLQAQLLGHYGVRVEGPPGSGKTLFLAALAATLTDFTRLAVLLDSGQQRPGYLDEHPTALTLSVPELHVRDAVQDLTHLLTRQMCEVVIADEVSAETVELLHDASLAGVRVWVAASQPIAFPDATLGIRLGLDPQHPVETIVAVRTKEEREQKAPAEPVYWIENGQYRFRP